MADFDKSTFDPKAAAEARKAEMEEITAKLEKGVKDIFEGENYKDYLNFCAKLPRYSVNNQILIMLQKPDATMCQSFGNWKDMNRFVKKGEKGIRILAPSPYKTEKEVEKTDASGNPIVGADGQPVKEKVEVTVNAFKPVSTFDISQTEGDPVPTIGTDELTASVEGFDKLFEALKETVPVPVTFEKIDSGAKGYFQVEENRIAIKEGMSEAQTLKTAIHEAAHQALHSKEATYGTDEKKTKNQKETEAESVAYVVCKHYGIDTSDYSFAYLATWSKDKETPELKASLDTIRRTASEMITKIDEKLQAHDISKEIDQFVEAHGDELPFAKPEAGRLEGYIKIVPPAETKEKEPEAKTSKKPSIKAKLKEEKAKADKSKTADKSKNKDMREAI